MINYMKNEKNTKNNKKQLKRIKRREIVREKEGDNEKMNKIVY